MTTPADWRATIPAIKDVESLRLVQRIAQFQREWLEIQTAQLDDVLVELEKQAKQLEGKAK